MKMASALPALLLLAPLGSLPAAPPAGLLPGPLPGPLASAPGRAPRPQKGEEDFRKKFKELMKIKAYDEMASMVQKRQQDAVFVVISACEGIAEQPTDELEALVGALRKAWKKAHGTKFVNIEYEYFSLLDPRYKRARRQLIQKKVLQQGEFEAAVKAKDRKALPEIGLEFKGLAEGFEQVGDWYMASECWWIYGNCFDTQFRGEKDADLKRACEGFGRMVSCREKIELKDRGYVAVKEVFEAYEAAGYGDPSKSKVKPAVSETGSGAVVTVPTTFELVEDLGAYVRPSYTTDGLYQLWARISVGKKGTQTKIYSLGDLSPPVFRESAFGVKIDSDGDGVGDVELPTTGKMASVSFEVGSGDERRPVAFLAVVGRQQDTFQGFDMDLGPQDDSMSIYICPAGSMVGTVGDTRIRVFDDNLNGVYGDGPLGWAFSGLRKKDYQVDMDCVVVEGEKRGRPWSEYMEIGGQWYRLESLQGGTSIQFEPVEVTAGTLKVKMKGLKPDWLIVQGEKDFERCYFDVMRNGSKGIQVPRGTYTLKVGRISKGKRQQTMKALILPSASTPSYTVSEGETTVITLGAPFGFDFEYRQTKDKINITGQSIVVTGVAGETYQRLWNCVVQPEVNFRKKGGSRGSKLGRLRSARSREELYEPAGWDAVWYPYDAELNKKKKGETVELQLFEKKNKLFGKIESEWR